MPEVRSAVMLTRTGRFEYETPCSNPSVSRNNDKHGLELRHPQFLTAHAHVRVATSQLTRFDASGTHVPPFLRRFRRDARRNARARCRPTRRQSHGIGICLDKYHAHDPRAAFRGPRCARASRHRLRVHHRRARHARRVSNRRERGLLRRAYQLERRRVFLRRRDNRGVAGT